MNIPLPYQRVVDLIKERYAELGILALMNILVMIVLQGLIFILNMVMQLFANLLYFMMLIGLIIIMLSPLIGGIITVGSMLLMFIFMIILFAILFLIMSAILGWNIVIARVVIDIRERRKCDFGPIFDHVTDNWKHYLKRGMGVASFQLLIIAPIMMSFMFGSFIVLFIIGAAIGYMKPDIGPLLFIGLFLIGYLLMVVLMIFLSPINQFIFDNGSVRIANGQGSWEGMIDSIIDMFRRRRLFGYYYLGSLLIQLLLFFVFPITMLVSFVLPIVTRAYIVVNDDL